MSWDVSVFASKAPPPPVEQMSDDWRGEELGKGNEVRTRISASFPGMDWSDPTWGIYEGDGFSLEFNIGRDEPNDGFMVHVRGAGDPVTPLLKMAESNGWYLLDCSAGEWLHHCGLPDEGWKGFQAYRNRVLGRS